MGACGLSWTVEVPPPGWSRFIHGWGVRGINGWGREVVFQPDRHGRVAAFAGSIGLRQAEPGLMDVIQGAVRAARVQDMPRPDGYGWKGGHTRKALCEAIAERLNAVGEPARVRTSMPPHFLLSDDEVAAIRARCVGGRA